MGTLRPTCATEPRCGPLSKLVWANNNAIRYFHSWSVGTSQYVHIRRYTTASLKRTTLVQCVYTRSSRLNVLLQVDSRSTASCRHASRTTPASTIDSCLMTLFTAVCSAHVSKFDRFLAMQTRDVNEARTGRDRGQLSRGQVQLSQSRG